MKNFLLLTVLIFTTSQAQASFLIEPFYGMALNGEVEDTNYDESYDSGSTLGARFGYQNMGLQLGVDYRIHSNEFEAANGTDVEYSHTGIYGFIGYEFPVLFRIYAGFLLSGEGSAEAGSVDVDYTDMSSTYFGISYTGLPFLAINFESVSYEHGTEEFSSSSSDADSDFGGTHYLLSLSVPFNL